MHMDLHEHETVMPAIKPPGMETRLSREILSVVESTAIAAARSMGLGGRELVDKAATETMRQALSVVSMKGTVIMGDKIDPTVGSLVSGEVIGACRDDDLELDVAVDPVEGTNLVAKGLPNAITALAVTEKKGLMKVPNTYMRKLIAGPSAKGRLDINAPTRYNLSILALSMEREISDITVVILDRPRNDELIQEVRDCGARIKLIRDGDVLPAIAAALADTGIHAVMGIGGASEGILSAAALKCLGGEIQAQFCWRDDADRAEAEALGIDLDEDAVYFTEDFVPAEEIVFTAAGITSGDILKGVRFFGSGVRTHSIVMSHSAGMVRFVDTVHLSGARKTPVKFGA
jgi:fructose-1,6-bisphosphatase II